MSAESAPFYWLLCDGCGTESNEDGGMLFGSVRDAEDDADDADWRTKDGRHFCDDCLPDWCLECEADITDANPRCEAGNGWACAACHSGCKCDVTP